MGDINVSVGEGGRDSRAVLPVKHQTQRVAESRNDRCLLSGCLNCGGNCCIQTNSWVSVLLLGIRKELYVIFGLK